MTTVGEAPGGTREAVAGGMSLADDYRAFMSGFPTGVAVISTLDAQARPRGVTCSSLVSVTVAPPVLMVNLSIHSRTLEAIRRIGGFGVNLLPARGRAVAELFASGQQDRFCSLHWQPRGRLGLPWLAGCCRGWAECELYETLVVADHELVLGRVIEAESTVEAPLLYGFRGFSAWRPAP